MDKLTLDQIGLKYNSDKSSEHHKYLDIYDLNFSKKRFEKNKILEIGIFNGESLKIFSEYFENSEIYAFDILDKRNLNIRNCNISIGDQSDRNFLDKYKNIEFDIIIDDGSHKMDHQQISFCYLFKFLKSGGIYIIEDLHTSLIDFVETVNHGNKLFNLSESGDNNTILFLNDIISGNDITRDYLDSNEIEYLKNNISKINIIESSERPVDNYWIANGLPIKESCDKSITSIITKK